MPATPCPTGGKPTLETANAAFFDEDYARRNPWRDARRPARHAAGRRHRLSGWSLEVKAHMFGAVLHDQ